MNPILAKIAGDARDAWLRIVHWINNSLASISLAIGAAYEARPDAVKAMVQQIPVWAYFIVAVPFFALINHALKKAKGGSQ